MTSSRSPSRCRGASPSPPPAAKGAPGAGKAGAAAAAAPAKSSRAQEHEHLPWREYVERLRVLHAARAALPPSAGGAVVYTTMKAAPAAARQRAARAAGVTAEGDSCAMDLDGVAEAEGPAVYVRSRAAGCKFGTVVGPAEYAAFLPAYLAVLRAQATPAADAPAEGAGGMRPKQRVKAAAAAAGAAARMLRPDGRRLRQRIRRRLAAAASPSVVSPGAGA